MLTSLLKDIQKGRMLKRLLKVIQKSYIFKGRMSNRLLLQKSSLGRERISNDSLKDINKTCICKGWWLNGSLPDIIKAYLYFQRSNDEYFEQKKTSKKANVKCWNASWKTLKSHFLAKVDGRMAFNKTLKGIYLQRSNDEFPAERHPKVMLLQMSIGLLKIIGKTYFCENHISNILLIYIKKLYIRNVKYLPKRQSHLYPKRSNVLLKDI